MTSTFAVLRPGPRCFSSISRRSFLLILRSEAEPEPDDPEPEPEDPESEEPEPDEPEPDSAAAGITHASARTKVASAGSGRAGRRLVQLIVPPS
jgi:hypothetical protein